MTARNFIIDTGILTLFFSGEDSVRSYFVDFERGKRNGHMTSINLSEFYYKTCEKMGEDVARMWYYQCSERLAILETNSELCLLSGKEKCHNGAAYKLSLADCFALAATRLLNGTLLTTDAELVKIKDVDEKYFKFE